MFSGPISREVDNDKLNEAGELVRENDGRKNMQRGRIVLQLSLFCLLFPAVALEEGCDLGVSRDGKG